MVRIDKATGARSTERLSLRWRPGGLVLGTWPAGLRSRPRPRTALAGASASWTSRRQCRQAGGHGLTCTSPTGSRLSPSGSTSPAISAWASTCTAGWVRISPMSAGTTLARSALSCGHGCWNADTRTWRTRASCMGSFTASESVTPTCGLASDWSAPGAGRTRQPWTGVASWPASPQRGHRSAVRHRRAATPWLPGTAPAMTIPTGQATRPRPY
jgi:hypothetical protein